MAHTIVTPSKLTWYKPPWWRKYWVRLDSNKKQLSLWIHRQIDDIINSGDNVHPGEKYRVDLPPRMVLSGVDGSHASGRMAKDLSLFALKLLKSLEREHPGWRIYADHSSLYDYRYTGIIVTPRSST